MYLWKCWRDTRIKFLVVLGLFLCLQVATLFGSTTGIPGNLNAGELRRLLATVLVVTSSVLVFVGWLLGDESVGADIGRGSGDFLLTRPSSRGSFVWTGWMVGMVESVVLWILFSAVIFGNIFSLFRRWGYSTSFLLSSWSGFSKVDLPLIFLMFVLNIGLIYGLTYCVGVIARSSSRALIGSAVLIAVYKALQALLMLRFHISLPDLLLSYQGPRHALDIPAIHSLVVRGLIALAFPVLAHFALERTEI